MSRHEMAEVKQAMDNLRALIAVVPVRLAALTSEQVAAKSAPSSWSIKEELGHLIDSAVNNHQRVVRAGLEDNLAMPSYDGDQWVGLHGYQNRDWSDLIALWRSLNRQLLTAAEAEPQSSWSHKLSIDGSESMTLAFVLVDYISHMSGHLRHIGIDVDTIVESSLNEASAYPERPAPVDYPINDLMRRRWSPRIFEERRPVEREKVLMLLEAARWSPSCFNDQPRYFLVFDGSNTETIERARACLSAGNAWANEAPVLMLSVARDTFEQNGKPNRWAQHDVGLATENLLLEAVELGLAAHPMAGYDAERARSEFGIPEGFTPIAMIAIGYPYRGDLNALEEKLRAKELAPRARKAIDEIAFAGTWGIGYGDGARK